MLHKMLASRLVLRLKAARLLAGPRGDPREARKLGLVLGGELGVDGGKRRLLARKLLVEVGRVGRVADRGEVWGRDALVVHVVEVDVGEELVALDLLGVGLTCTEAAKRVASQKLALENCSQEVGSPFAEEKRPHAAW